MPADGLESQTQMLIDCDKLEANRAHRLCHIPCLKAKLTCSFYSILIYGMFNFTEGLEYFKIFHLKKRTRSASDTVLLYQSCLFLELHYQSNICCPYYLSFQS